MSYEEVITHFIPLLLLIILPILFYAALKKISFPGHNALIITLSIIISILILASKHMKNFLLQTITSFSLILIVSFLFIMLFSFISKDISIVSKPIIWAISIISSIILAILIFNNFPQIYHMMPFTSDNQLTNHSKEIKDFIYSDKFVHNFLFIAITSAIAIFLAKK